MEVARLKRNGYRRGGHKNKYLVTLNPESFALSLYCLILSILVANLLWMNVLYLCSSLEFLDIHFLLNQLISVHLVFAVATTYIWWLLLQDRGRSIITHVTFFVWQGSKLFSSALEICSFARFFDYLVNNTPKDQMVVLTRKMVWGFVIIGIIECMGFLLAYKYLKARKPDRQINHKVLQKPQVISTMV